MISTKSILLSLLLAALFVPSEVKAQALSTRVGLSTELIMNPFIDELTDRTAGIGIRGRVGFGFNDDLSLGVGLGVVSFIFDGTSNAEHIINPQLSLIVSLPGTRRFPYIFGGVGSIFRTGGDLSSRTFLNLHVGYGLAFPLSESTFFFEIDPQLIVMSESSNLLIPLRVGVIF